MRKLMNVEYQLRVALRDDHSRVKMRAVIVVKKIVEEELLYSPQWSGIPFQNFFTQFATNQLCNLVDKRMFRFLQFDFSFFMKEPNVLNAENFLQKRIDQLNMNEHFVVGAANADQGGMH